VKNRKSVEKNSNPAFAALHQKAADARAIRDAAKRDAGRPKLTLDEMRARLAAKGASV
jgi:hypothetical protein